MKDIQSLEIVDSFLQSFEVAWKKTLANYSCSQDQLISGSRLRPLMVLWGYLSTCDVYASADISYIANVAVSIELIHKATIILDDWIDEDEKRHGKPAFHIEYGPHFSVIMALHMVSDSILRLKGFLPDDPDLSNSYYYSAEILAQTIHSMSKGALEELRLTNKSIFDLRQIKLIAQLETAEIIGNAMQLGYFSGHGDRPEISALLKKTGDKFGYLFQAMNDLEAFYDSNMLAVHKGNINNDISISRKNLGVAILYNMANKADRDMMVSGSPEVVGRLIKKYKILDYIMTETELFCESIPSQLQQYVNEGLSQNWISDYLKFIDQMKQAAYIKLGLE